MFQQLKMKVAAGFAVDIVIPGEGFPGIGAKFLGADDDIRTEFSVIAVCPTAGG